jgi:beta-galactosidase
METRRRTWFDARGLVVDDGGAGRHLPFYAGAMHYWRVPPAQWAACLRAIHAQGLTIVDTCVPWRVHEPTAGQRAWTGERDLGAFLAAARAAGLAVALRPGPSVGAELTSFGLPDWVLADPECQARTARGTPAWLPAPPRAFPLPSYASATFRERVAGWYAAVAEIVEPHLAPEGPVVAIGIDHGSSLRTGAFDIDYHPDALAAWREASGLDDPPRAWRADDAARCALWIRLQDVALAHALGGFAKQLAPLGVARFHDHHPDMRRIQAAIDGPVGIAASLPRARFPELRRRAAALLGNADPIPIAFDVGVGAVPWLPPLDPGNVGDATRDRDQLLALLAAGVRGFDLAMAVERERFYGAAIDQRGQVEASWIKPLIVALAEVDWPSLRRAPTIALIDSQADARFGLATSTLAPFTPALADLLDLGPAGAAELGTDAGAIAARRWHATLVRALELAQVPYTIVDESAPEDELARYRVVIAPTHDRVDRGLWQRLRALAEHKRAVVVIGPQTPTRDELDQPLGEPAAKRMGRLQPDLTDLASLAEDLRGLAGEASDAWQIERPDLVRAMPFATADHVVRVVFVASDADRAVTAVLLAGDGATAVRDPLTKEVLRVADHRIAIALPPRGVRMLIVE